MSDAAYPSLHGETARRQFRISLFMVIGLALAAALAGFVTPPAPQRAAGGDETESFTGRLVAVGE
jgi:hypothetical protein